MVSLIVLGSLRFLVVLFSLLSLSIPTVIVSLAFLRIHVVLSAIGRLPTNRKARRPVRSCRPSASRPFAPIPLVDLGSLRSLDRAAIFSRRDRVGRSDRKVFLSRLPGAASMIRLARLNRMASMTSMDRKDRIGLLDRLHRKA